MASPLPRYLVLAARAYQSSISDTIALRFKVLYEINGKPNGVQARNLSEGKPNVSSPPPRQMAIETMETKIRQALKGYSLLFEAPHIPYFYTRGLTGKPKGKDGVNSFKKPAKAYELALVIDPDEWDVIICAPALHLQRQTLHLPQSKQRSIPRSSPYNLRANRVLPHFGSPSQGTPAIQGTSKFLLELAGNSLQNGIAKRIESKLCTTTRASTDDASAPVSSKEGALKGVQSKKTKFYTKAQSLKAGRDKICPQPQNEKKYSTTWDGHGYGFGYEIVDPDPNPENPNPNPRVYGLSTGCPK
ncbi:hypothetical protein B0H13DRAFT_1907471 [Mycena leptocephala]|nr:hypothetical protein B0H13DRAFT_1907471 [Mycena leptocephala]